MDKGGKWKGKNRRKQMGLEDLIIKSEQLHPASRLSFSYLDSRKSWHTDTWLTQLAPVLPKLIWPLWIILPHILLMLRRLQKRQRNWDVGGKGFISMLSLPQRCEWQKASVVIVGLGSHCSISRALKLRCKHLSRDAENKGKHYWDHSADQVKEQHPQSQGCSVFFFQSIISTKDQGNYELSSSRRERRLNEQESILLEEF